MTVGIIGAMKVEMDGLKAAMTETSVVEYSGIEYISGKIGGVSVVAAMCGIGKVFAAICAQTMILKFDVDMLVNIGVAGTLTSELNVLDVAVADGVIQHDMDTSPLGDPVGLISGINIVKIPADDKLSALLADCVRSFDRKAIVGTIASGDQFIDSKEKKNDICSKFEVMAAEMEGGAIGHVCYVNKVPFSILRTISDGDGGSMDYAKFVVKAAEVSIEVVKKFVAAVGEL